MKLIPLPAFSDNYIWMLHDGQSALVVDPGEAAPVLTALQELGLKLQTILVTHHHPDHVGGVAELRDATSATVYGPARERIPEPVQRLGSNDHVQALGLNWRVIDVPGHTAGHIAFFTEAVEVDEVSSPVLFCGDTLFSGGCGRLFEGTPAQMLTSLDELASLPDTTQVCCTHEYTLSNLRFAVAVEPDNQELVRYQSECITLRELGLPTLPSSMALERQINPFLRTRLPSVAQVIRHRDPAVGTDAEVFGAMREWKNQFR